MFQRQKIFSARRAKYPALLQFLLRWRYVALQTAIYIFSSIWRRFRPNAFNGFQRTGTFLTLARFYGALRSRDRATHRGVC